MALKSAKAYNLNVGSGMAKAKAWFDDTWKSANKEAGLNPSDHMSDVSIFPYV